jgi:hypothetical protein
MSIISDRCADLVSDPRFEDFLWKLFSDTRGEWMQVQETLRGLGLDSEGISDSTFATWLDWPEGDEAFVFVMMYDIESGGSLTAAYNRSYLVEKREKECGK